MILVLLFYCFSLLISFYLLARVCDEYFVPALDQIAKRWKMPSDVAGATLMAMGSSAPELFVAVIALLRPGGHEAVGMGTIVGSAIFNILVIIGASAIVAKRAVLRWQAVMRDVLFYTLSIGVLLWAFSDGKIVILEAGIFAALYFVYILILYFWKYLQIEDDKVKEITIIKKKGARTRFYQKMIDALDWLMAKLFPSSGHYYYNFFISIIFIAVLSWVLVESAIEVAHLLSISEAIIALTVLAAGTSIPDLISSMVVAKQGRGGMAISNAVGSNIFDILFGLGVPWLFLLVFANEYIPVNVDNLFSSVVLLFATVLVILFLLLARKWKIGYKVGYFLIGLYIVYLVWAVIRVV